MQWEATIWQKLQLCTFYHPSSVAAINGAEVFQDGRDLRLMPWKQALGTRLYGETVKGLTSC